MKKKKVINSPRNNGFRMNAMWVFIFMAIGSATVYGAIWLFAANGLKMINQYLEYMVYGVFLGSLFLALMMFLRKKIQDRFIRRMATILCVFAVATICGSVVRYFAALPYLHAYTEHNGNKLAIMCHMTINQEVSDRLNAASAQYMADAEAAAAAAQAAGESFEEVPNTVTGMDLLTTYSAFPIKYKFFYDTGANVDGLVYTLYGATSADIKWEWIDNTCHLYAEGAEAEGESFTTVE